MSKAIGRSALALVAAGIFGLAAAAGAEEGQGVMVEKDLAASTVTLMNGTVLRVSDRTRITRRVEGKGDLETIGFADLSHARAFGGGLEVNGEHQVRWSGDRRSGDVVAADRIEVLGILLE
jgi:hypothetical protein